MLSCAFSNQSFTDIITIKNIEQCYNVKWGLRGTLTIRPMELDLHLSLKHFMVQRVAISVTTSIAYLVKLYWL